MKAIAKPFGLLLMWLYEFFGNYGLAVIVFAFLVKLVLHPFLMKSKRGMMKMARLQPQIKELQTRHAANKTKLNEEVQKLYQREKVNPMSGCVWSLIPFPILIALYYAIRCPLTTMMGIPAELLAEGGAIANKLAELNFDPSAFKTAYLEIGQTSFISSHFDAFSGLSDKLRQIDYSFLGLDLGAQPQWNFLFKADWSNKAQWLPAFGLFLIPFIAALLTYLSATIARKVNPASATDQQGQALTYMMPLMTLWFGFIMPAALGLYWIASYLFGIIQDTLLTKHYMKVLDAEDAVRIEEERKKEEEIARKREETARLKAENATVVNKNTSKRKQHTQQRQEQSEKALEYDRRKNPKEEDDNPSRVGTRRYARGRAYDPNRFDTDMTESAPSTEETAAPEEPAEAAEDVKPAVPEYVPAAVNTPAVPADDEFEEEYDDPDEFDDEEEFDDDPDDEDTE